MKEKLSIQLMFRILELVCESGAKQEEAMAALRAAEALLPQVGLERQPTMEIET